MVDLTEKAPELLVLVGVVGGGPDLHLRALALVGVVEPAAGSRRPVSPIAVALQEAAAGFV